MATCSALIDSMIVSIPNTVYTQPVCSAVILINSSLIIDD